ncbi:Multidrug resistance protein MdtA precursor [Rubripirellula obstinata]|uniref:Multidrug resistance protein MdtA n=1 Tax=Rubripirellula obstinata TaxID=406547 RepID=A0A5B1CNG4_9BACT|nr:efflux RND transporter periplasmic adaptor subunit [Rubripirellula obstinata]KAA1261902.1 Multidrug resistance protein MdtA precursor [Rubripirellula obstinata]
MKRILKSITILAFVAATGGVVFWYSQQSESASDPSPVAVDVSPSRLSVKVVPATRGPIQAWVFAEGTARSAQREYLTFEATGRVTKVTPEKPGTPVKKGDILAELDKRTFAADVDAAMATIQDAKTQVEASLADADQAKTSSTLQRRQYERAQQLYRQNASSKQELEEAKAAMENAESAVQSAKARARSLSANIAVAEAKLKQAQIYLENAQIVSPIDGIVAYMNIEEGFYFTQNFVKTSSESEALSTIPFVVIDPSQYEVIVDVPSFDAERIKVGQKVIVLPGGTADQTILGTLEGKTNGATNTEAAWQASAEVYSVNPAINPGGRSVQVKIRTTGNVESLRDGMFVTCWIATEESDDAIIAPLDAFLYEENRPYVFVYQPSLQSVERRSVTFGIRGLSRYEVASGVKADEMIVTDGRYKLVDGTPVSVISGAD